MLKAKLIERGIPGLDLITTVNGFQAVGMFIVQPQSQALKVLKHLILTFQIENPRVTRIVINDDKNKPLAAHGANPRGADSVHMEQLPGPLETDMTYPENVVKILDQKSHVTRHKMIKFFKIQWSNHTVEEATWESEYFLHSHHPDFELP
jgi:hypothetical protein